MKKSWAGLMVAILISIIAVLIFTQTTTENEKVKIGAVLILTGSDARAGQSAKEGIGLAVEEINKNGGISGKKLQIIYEDDQGQPQQAVAAVKKLINIDKVPAIIGPMWSTSLLAIAPIAEESEVVILSPTASAPEITRAGDYIFRNTYSDLYEGTKDAEYAYKELSYRKAGIMYINLDAGIQITDVFSTEFKRLGGDIVLKEAYDADSKDFRSILTKLKSKPVDFIYLMGYSEMGQVVKQAEEMGVKAPFLSTIMFEISDVLKVAGEAAEGTIYSFPSYDPNKGGEMVQEFSKNYQMRYNQIPGPEAAFSYDATKILSLAISRGGTDPAAIKRELYGIKDYQGVTGETSFDKNGDVIKPIGFKQVKNGKYVWRDFQY